jgi:hypothetical protein
MAIESKLFFFGKGLLYIFFNGVLGWGFQRLAGIWRIGSGLSVGFFRIWHILAKTMKRNLNTFF